MEVIEKLVFEVKIYKGFSQVFFYQYFHIYLFPINLSLPTQNLTALPSFPKEAHGSQKSVIWKLGALYSD